MRFDVEEQFKSTRGFPCPTAVPLSTGSKVQGTVLNERGRPAPKIPVVARATTGEDGKFTITGIPDADMIVSAGSSQPTNHGVLLEFAKTDEQGVKRFTTGCLGGKTSSGVPVYRLPAGTQPES